MTQKEWKTFLRLAKEKGEYCEVMRRINKLVSMGYSFAKTLPEFINAYPYSTLKAAFRI